jgi:hypothetical protein
MILNTMPTELDELTYMVESTTQIRTSSFHPLDFSIAAFLMPWLNRSKSTVMKITAVYLMTQDQDVTAK